jgi:hypothetical protein
MVKYASGGSLFSRSRDQRGVPEVDQRSRDPENEKLEGE